MSAGTAKTSEKSEVRGYPVRVPRMTAIESACDIFTKKDVADTLGISVRALYDKREGNTGISDAEVRILIRDLSSMADRCSRIVGNLVNELRPAEPAPAARASHTEGATV